MVGFKTGIRLAKLFKVPAEMLADETINDEDVLRMARSGPLPTPDEPLPGIRGELLEKVREILSPGVHHMLAAYSVDSHGTRKVIVIQDNEVVRTGTEPRMSDFTGRRKEWPKDV